MKPVFIFLAIIGAIFAFTNCGGPWAGQLEGPSGIGLSGTGTFTSSTGSYMFANSSGTVVASSNTLLVTFNDWNLPLMLATYNGAFSDVQNTGSCSSLGSLVASITSGGNGVQTNFTASGCTDQAQVIIYLDTTQIYDQAGDSGWGLVSYTVTVDQAPKVTSPATGNSASNGSGTTEGSSGTFNISSSTDQSIVVTFSKSLSSGTLNGTLTGCAATLGTPAIVSGTNGTIVAWPLGNLGGVSVGQSCTLNVSGVKDSVGNAEDPSDINVSMNFTFN